MWTEDHEPPPLVRPKQPKEPKDGEAPRERTGKAMDKYSEP